jgi:serine/threonine protein kinase
MASDPGGDTTRASVTVPEFGLVGSVIRSRYRVNAVSSVDRDVVVFSAEDIRHDRPVALKVLRGELARDAEFAAAVRAQSRALAKAAHVLRGVQRVHESGDTETGQLFVVLEWVEGATLHDVLQAGGALAAPTALRVAIRVGEALEALHHNGLVHGRLGPDSVVMVKDGERIRLVGTELAAAYRTPAGRRVHDRFPLGSPAPEAAERGEATEATDVYALGMLLQQLLTAGKTDPTPGSAPPTPPLSPSIRRIITTALEPRPERRYRDISVMVNDIWGAAAIITERDSRRPVKRSRNGRRRVRRREGFFPLQVAAVVGAAGVAVAMVWFAGLDRIAIHLYSRVTPPAVTAHQVERGVPATSGVAPSNAAPRESATPPQSTVVEDSAPVERGAAAAVRESPAASPPASAPRVEPPATPPRVEPPPSPPRIAPSAAAPSAIDGRPRPIEKSPPAVAPRAPAESRTVAAPRPSTDTPAAPRSQPTERREPVGPAPSVQRGAETSDGSAAVDWLLKDRR